jgi:YHS domain-containing protein
MFDGNKECSICKNALKDNERNFGVSLLGTTYVFCNKCMGSKKEEIKLILHDE